MKRRRSARIGLLLVVLALGGGCGGAEADRQAATPLDTQRLSQADLGWLERYGNWVTRHNRTATRAGETNVALLGGGSSVAELGRSLRPLRECQQSFERSVGRATPSRFEPVEPVIGRACAELRLAAEQLVKSFDDPAEHAYAAEEHFSKATTLFLDIDAAIQRRLAANRPLPASASGKGESRVHPRLGRIASRFAGRQIEVRCWSSGDWSAIKQESNAYGNRNIDLVGMADPMRDRIHLAPTICAGLDRLLGGERALYAALAEAVETLAHEIEHILAPGTERRVECAAIQRTSELARAIGVDRALARKLAWVYWLEVYPDMPDNYWSPHCKNDGAFDVHPESGSWPTA